MPGQSNWKVTDLAVAGNLGLLPKLNEKDLDFLKCNEKDSTFWYRLNVLQRQDADKSLM